MGGGVGGGCRISSPCRKICQGDVISLRPTMKVISQSKGISREPWLLQRPRKLGPMTLFMSDRQPYPEGNLNGLGFFHPEYNPCALLTFFTLAIYKSKTEGSKRQDTRQILYCERVPLSSARACVATCSCKSAGCKTFLINMHLFMSTNRNSGYCKRSCPPLGACV